jgi:hypothetical protein
MRIGPTHFIEVIKVSDSKTRNLAAYPIHTLKWTLDIGKKHGIETIAVFKIYLKPTPAIVTYDYDLKTMIVE